MRRAHVGDLRIYLGVVVNPLARKNRGKPGDRSAALRRMVGPWGEGHETGSVDDLREIVERLYPRVSHLVSDGGDGAQPIRNAGPHSWPQTAAPVKYHER